MKKYQFLRSWSVVWYKPIGEDWFETLADTEEKEVKILPLKQVIDMLKPNKEEKQFIELAPYIVFFKDWRDDLRRDHAYRWTFFFHAVADFFNIDYEDVGYLTLAESEDAIKLKKADRKLINIRKNNTYI